MVRMETAERVVRLLFRTVTSRENISERRREMTFDIMTPDTIEAATFWQKDFGKYWFLDTNLV